MNELNLFNNSKTITSLEIAELTGKQHKHVLVDIDKMLSALEIKPADFSARYKDGKGESRRCYNLPKRESLILASGYNVVLRAAIIDRWAELEAKEQSLKLPDFNNPVIAAREWANQYEAKQIAQAQLELQAPKVKFADNIIKSDENISMANMAKLINMGRNKLFKMLREDKVLMSNGIYRNTPYQKHIDAGHFVVTETALDKGKGLFMVTLVTPKGQNYIINKYK